MSGLDRIMTILETRGAGQYDDEPVSQLQHALQCAHRAEASGAPARLVVAALLHDIGHLIHGLGDDPAGKGIDDRHERLGERFLSRWFDETVTAPVGLHVDAKRCLCAIDPAYFGTLSAASVRSLELQGGPFGKAEAAAFMDGPHARDAIAVRRWDEQSKDPVAVTPDLEHYRGIIASVIRG
ncbi:MAG: HD domain-containing protein [Alphaproteobacteria bacterium]|nr:HD domain-containing protein [Alphaproteobacteria bacterium]